MRKILFNSVSSREVSRRHGVTWHLIDTKAYDWHSSTRRRSIVCDRWQMCVFMVKFSTEPNCVCVCVRAKYVNSPANYRICLVFVNFPDRQLMFWGQVANLREQWRIRHRGERQKTNGILACGFFHELCLLFRPPTHSCSLFHGVSQPFFY